MHTGRTIRAALVAFKGNIYQKHLRDLSYPTATKYILIKGGYITIKNMHAVSAR
jgi:hypothetical protein